MIDVAVIDYGVGNLLSVSRALEHCGARANVTADPAAILAAERVLLPGVGSFASGMQALRRHGLDAVVGQVAAAGTPLLGICLGMQMLFDESEEFGVTAGLGLIPGRVVRMPSVTTDGALQKIPHIGWNELTVAGGRAAWQHRLLADVVAGDAVYFVHSYMAEPTDPAHRLADCDYGGTMVSAVVGRDNVLGCQFHPEKSGEVGLKILRRFLLR
jgi:glutamine amidotransferase